MVSHWDINPTEAEDKEIGADLALFKTKYNGKINWVQTTWETKFDDLAALVMSMIHLISSVLMIWTFSLRVL